jgi:hypothetical protein
LRRSSETPSPAPSPSSPASFWEARKSVDEYRPKGDVAPQRTAELRVDAATPFDVSISESVISAVREACYAMWCRNSFSSQPEVATWWKGESPTPRLSSSATSFSGPSHNGSALSMHPQYAPSESQSQIHASPLLPLGEPPAGSPSMELVDSPVATGVIDAAAPCPGDRPIIFHNSTGLDLAIRLSPSPTVPSPPTAYVPSSVANDALDAFDASAPPRVVNNDQYKSLHLPAERSTCVFLARDALPTAEVDRSTTQTSPSLAPQIHWHLWGLSAAVYPPSAQTPEPRSDPLVIFPPIRCFPLLKPVKSGASAALPRPDGSAARIRLFFSARASDAKCTEFAICTGVFIRNNSSRKLLLRPKPHAPSCDAPATPLPLAAHDGIYATAAIVGSGGLQLACPGPGPPRKAWSTSVALARAPTFDQQGAEGNLLVATTHVRVGDVSSYSIRQFARGSFNSSGRREVEVVISEASALVNALPVRIQVSIEGLKGEKGAEVR